MAYDIKTIVNLAGGKSYIKRLVEEEAYTYEMLQKVLGIKTSSRLTLKKFITYCEAEIKYPRLSRDKRIWLMQMDRYNGEYWNSKYILNILHKRLKNPIINITGTSSRYVVSCNKHPRASASNQVKAHIILWEVINKQFLPIDLELEPIDKDFTNLKIINFKLRSILGRKSSNAKGISNPAYKHGLSIGNNQKKGNWENISKEFRVSNIIHV